MSAHRTLARLVGCALVVCGAAGSASAQVAVFPVRGLSFGVLSPGVAEQVDPEDAGRRAEIELRGSGEVVITALLPTDLVSAGGHRIPLQFSRGDAAIEMRSTGKDRNWNPNKPKHLNIKDREGGAVLYLGGLALPAAKQPPGEYRATIVLQVAAPGT